MENKPFSKRSLRAGLSGHTVLITFVLSVLIAGSNAIAIRFSDLGLPPLSIFLAFVLLATAFLANAHGLEALRWRRVVVEPEAQGRTRL